MRDHDGQFEFADGPDEGGVGAAVSGYTWYRDRNKTSSNYTTLAIAILCLAAGLIMSIKVMLAGYYD